MANVPDSSLKTWNDGDTLHASDYDQDRQILQVAINDNNTRIGNQETKTKNIATDGSDYTGTWKGFSVDQVKNLATSIKTKTWTASSGQTVFTLGSSDDPYVIGNNSTELLIGGVPQVVGEGYTETNTTTITASEGVASGVEVVLRYQLTMAVTDTPISQLIGYSALALLSQFASSIAANGYINLPGGLLIQWGTVTAVPNSTLTTVTLPIPFKSAVFGVLPSVINASGSCGWELAPSPNQLSQIQLIQTQGNTRDMFYAVIGK